LPIHYAATIIFDAAFLRFELFIYEHDIIFAMPFYGCCCLRFLFAFQSACLFRLIRFIDYRFHFHFDMARHH